MNKKFKGKVDYEVENYCITCREKYPKTVLFCKICKLQVRTKPRHRPDDKYKSRIAN